jgi:hypothetical protein
MSHNLMNNSYLLFLVRKEPVHADVCDHDDPKFTIPSDTDTGKCRETKRTTRWHDAVRRISFGQ